MGLTFSCPVSLYPGTSLPSSSCRDRNPANLNMCSSCFRQANNANAQPSPQPEVKSVAPAVRNALAPTTTTAAGTSALPVPEAKPMDMVCEPCQPEPSKEAAVVAAGTPSRPPQKHKNRCYSCRKKIGLTGFTCRCGYVFCSEHRYSDKHDCPFDYKAQGKQLLTKANPTISPAKLEGF